MASSEDILAEVPIQVFEIYLQQEEYFPGEIMTGKLLVLTSKPVVVDGILLKFEGKGVAKWQQRPSYLCGFQKAEFVAGKNIFFTNVFRYDLRTIPEGSSAFPFEFEIPTGIPQTIGNGVIMKRVKVKYSVDALIRTTNEDYHQSKQFLVKGLLNLNAFPELSLPVCKTVKEIIFESCWTPSGTVMVFNFSLKKQGFVPGEAVTAELLIKDCEHEVALFSSVEVQMIQEVVLKVGKDTHITRRILAKSDIVQVKSDQDKCGKKSNKKFTFGLKIPDDLVISYENLRKQNEFISIKYFLRMTMLQSSFPYKTLHTQIPIKIGSVWIKAKKGPPLQIQSTVPIALPKTKILLEQKQNPTNCAIYGVNDLPNPLPPRHSRSVPAIMVNSKSPLEKLNTPPRTPKQKKDKNEAASSLPSRADSLAGDPHTSKADIDIQPDSYQNQDIQD